jgi:hypothetical protein
MICHFDRSDALRREAEKSIKKRISRLAPHRMVQGSLEMTVRIVFYRAF